VKIRFLVASAALLLTTAAEAQMAPQPMQNPGKDKNEPQSDVLPDIDQRIGNDAQLTFAQAEKAYRNHDWLEAVAYYQHLRAKFSYNVPLATQAQLRLGDVAFAREKWLEAKEYYKQFLRMHPTHEKADYAAYQIGLCAYKDIPGEFFLFPSGAERDQSEVRTARVALTDFLTKYPKSEFVAQAKEILAKCDDKLADHELYVADYYAGKGKWEGAVQRAEGLVKTLPDSSRLTDALLLAIKGRAQLNQPAEAKRDYELLAALKPKESVLKSAQKMLPKE
jgi:outer membrane protein assembly factor BamD